MSFLPINSFPEFKSSSLTQDTNILVEGPLKTGRISIKEFSILVNGAAPAAAPVSTATVWNNTAASGTTLAGNGYYVDTTLAPISLSLPAGATSTNGDRVVFKDKAGTFGTNALTITSDVTIEGLAQPLTVGVNNTYVALEFVFGNWIVA